MMKSLDELRALIALLATGAVACSSSDPSTAGGVATDGGVTVTATKDGGALPDGGVDHTGFGPLCTPESYDALAGTSLATPADYYELREQLQSGSDAVATLSKSGTPCATAAQGASCMSSLSAFRSAEGVPRPSVGNGLAGYDYLLVNRGDTITAVTTLDEIRKAFVPVDTAKDAAFIATFGTPRYVQCSTATVKETGAGYEVIVQSGGGCGADDDVVETRVAVGRDGTQSDLESRVVKKGDPGCVYGRVPEGLVACAGTDEGASVGDHFARAARLEAASVVAFERIACELAAHGAPEELVAMAGRSADEERRHAAITGALARRHGVEPLAAEVEEPTPRSLFELALENAREGCVRETFGALVATRQALAAEDAEVRAAMASLAEDETRHAWFSWELHRWASAKLGADAGATLESARQLAITAFAAALEGEEMTDEVRRTIGYPARPEAAALFEGLFASPSV